MKRIIILLSLGLPLSLLGQSNLDFSPFRSQDKGDPVAAGNEARNQMMNNRWGMEQQQRTAELERKVREAALRAQQGNSTMITTDNSTIRTKRPTTSSNNVKQRQQAQRDYEHRQWLEQRQASIEAEKERRRLEELRKQELQLQKYHAAKAESLQKNARYYGNLQNDLNYRATEGRDFMYNYKPEYMEPMKSEYIPSGNSSSANIASIVAQRGSTSVLSLTGYESSSNMDQIMDKALAKALKQMKEQELKPVQIDRKTENYIWELESKLDEGQMKMLLYYLKSNNLKEVSTETETGTKITKKGVMPTAIGINDAGNYIFETADGNRVFSVSANGRHIQMASLEEHSWNDDNIIKKIQEGGIEQYLKESFGIKGVFKNGEFTWDEWKGKPAEEIATKLPRIKAEIKMSLFDNSSKVTYQYYYLAPQSNGNFMVGVKGALEGGGKAEVRSSVGATGASLPSASVTTASASASVTTGIVYTRGDRYILCTDGATASTSLVLDWKTIVKPSKLARGSIKYIGLTCKDITNP